MVDSVLHAEPYTKQELCQFFGLTVCMKGFKVARLDFFGGIPPKFEH